ncbi:hypothetical protein JNB_04865 [Janibacter sp. HTCC2649]|nr:hypothetical protein JNB_04865 [Janibacter sp. HTCC2649]
MGQAHDLSHLQTIRYEITTNAHDRSRNPGAVVVHTAHPGVLH